MFLGRNDDQVKIRGFRIEPGEIAARLVEHPFIREAVVVTQGKKTDKRLVAYIVTQPGDQDTSADAGTGLTMAGTLRDYLSDRLPDYMVPSAFVRLNSLPLTGNGKLDRRALPVPESDAFAHAAYEAPLGKIELTLAGVWSELLGVEHVGRHDNFFALGGAFTLGCTVDRAVTAPRFESCCARSVSGSRVIGSGQHSWATR
nr:hypothetical protein [Aeromonas hydrophila]